MELSGPLDAVRAEDSPEESSQLRDELQRAVHPRYQVADEIGRGGMAYVYRGWDTVEQRTVAFKVLKRHLVAALGPSRFLREVRLLSQLRHPSILSILQSGHTDTLYYYVMPLVDGETLERRLLRERQLPVSQVRRIISQAAAALDFAHEAGVIHRDIKPSNLFLTGDQTLLADFGIAKDLSHPADERTTSTGLVLGTALYMSPEQADADWMPDRRSDVYSLGCVAYEMVVGDPPFTGPSVQAVIARHRTLPAPSARVVRPELPRGVDAVIRKALAKSPADRYERAGDFAAALSDPAQLAAAAREADDERPGSRRLGWAIAAALVLAAAVPAAMLLRPARPLSYTRVVVFPMEETPPRANQAGIGAEVALMIGNALEFTEPLVWIDGISRLSSAARRDVTAITAREARRVSREAGARWYVDGSVLRRGDSVTVVLRLNDAAGDSLVARRSATRLAPQAAQAGLDAVNQLLPQLLAPGQRLGDLSALADRSPAAVANWLEGDREYRRFNFAAALEFERRAVAADSLLAVAALRGAQAASWLNDLDEGSALARVAVRHASLLPPRTADFATGLDAYLTGQADSAVSSLRRALARSPQWTEAHMALGEVYYHLLPSIDGPPDSLAEIEFRQAAADTGFTPPLYHLAEIAVRRGTVAEAESAAAGFLRRVTTDSSRAHLTAMLACVRDGRGAVQWPRLAAAQPLEALSAAMMLAVAGRFTGCAEDGFRAVLATAPPLNVRWGAVLGLQGVLAAEGRTTELRALLDTAAATIDPSAAQLLILDALAGVDVDTAASDVVRRLGLHPGSQARPFTVWLIGEWYASRGNRAATETMRKALNTEASKTSDPRARRFGDALAARLRLLEGDTAGTIAALRPLLSVGRRDDLDWSIGESLAPARLLLARLLMAQRKPADALAVAGLFDHQAPSVFLPFLPASLVLRRDASRALGRPADARRFDDRLAALGQGSVHLFSNSSTSTREAR